jgi:7,8-dihydroneopterin aldolase/epimerase/oxygenase
MAWIALEGVRFFAHHGYYEEEALLGSEFVVNVYVEMKEGEKRDELGSTVNYESLFRCCRDVMRGTRQQLIETLATDICRSIRTRHPNIIRVRARVEKLNPPLPGSVDRSWTEFEM